MFYALCVGIDRYADSRIPPLRNARSDAAGVARAIDERVGGAANVMLLLDEQATKGAIARLLTSDLPRAVRPTDTVLLYFATHGCPDVAVTASEPSLHLLTAETDYPHVASTSINLVSELSEWTRRLPARLTFMVLDASFGGLGGGRTVEGPGLRSGPRLRSPARLPLSKVTLGERCALLAACGECENVCEEPGGAHSALARSLIEIVRGTCEADDLRPARIHRELSLSVRTQTRGAQNPKLLRGADATAPLFPPPQSAPTTRREAKRTSAPPPLR